jgi:hypothetical protein
VGPRACVAVVDKRKIRIPDRLGCSLVTVPAALFGLRHLY